MRCIWLLLASAFCFGAVTAQMQSFLNGYDACLTAQDPPSEWLTNWRLHCKTLYNRTQADSYVFFTGFLRCTHAYFLKSQARNVTNDCIHAAYVAEAAAEHQSSALESACFLLNPINEVCPANGAQNATLLHCLPSQPRRCRTYVLREKWDLCTCAHRRSTKGGGP